MGLIDSRDFPIPLLASPLKGKERRPQIPSLALVFLCAFASLRRRFAIYLYLSPPCNFCSSTWFTVTDDLLTRLST